MIFYIDWLYIILMLPALIFTIIASAHVDNTFKKYSKIETNNGLTGAQVARKILDAHGLTEVSVESTKGKLTDHYDPKTKTIRLSQSTYTKSNCAAVGIVAHEVGHAIQDAEGYAPLAIRNAIIPVTNFGARLSTPLILIGIILSIFGQGFAIIAYIGVAMFALTVLFQLITLPVEYNASKRALKNIEDNNLLDEQQQIGAKKVLKSAALTYVGALAVSISQLFYLLIVVASHTRRD